MTQSMYVHGMHGLGDNLHQRAIIRELVKDYTVTLETSWPCIYHDLPVRLVHKPVALRTQLKNAQREQSKFISAPPLHHQMNRTRIAYGRRQIAESPSKTLLEAMYQSAGIQARYADADFSLPVPQEWYDQLTPIMSTDTTKPILVYRPLVARPEWRGSQVRNANSNDYAALFATIRDHYFVVSVADLEPTREWIVGPELHADVTLHKGELHFEALAALFARADLVFTSSGFGAVLAPAVGTPCVSVLGGYEPASWLADGAKLAPWLGIQPVRPCECGTSSCTNPCDKRLDMTAAKATLCNFTGISPDAETRPVAEMFDMPRVADVIPVQRHTLRQALVRPGNPRLLGHVHRGSVKA